jgi:hypothetical protein
MSTTPLMRIRPVRNDDQTSPNTRSNAKRAAAEGSEPAGKQKKQKGGPPRGTRKAPSSPAVAQSDVRVHKGEKVGPPTRAKKLSESPAKGSKKRPAPVEGT